MKENILEIIAIDNDVKKSFPKYLKVKVVRNFLFNLIKTKKVYFRDGYLNLGYIGSYLKYKGLEDLILVFNKLNKKKKKN